MLICSDCGLVFEEPKQYSEDYTPGGAFEGGSFIQRYEGCPSCAGAFEEARECECCGEYFPEEMLEDTEGYVNGGCGYCCEGCIDAGDMKPLW